MENALRVEIEVQIDDAYAGRVGPDLLVRAARATLRQQGVAGPVALALVVAGDGTVRRLNRTFRGVDAPTDVLAFQSGEQAGFVADPEAPPYLGDVIVSLPRAEAQAQRAGHPLEAELQLLAVHGVLHLLGHDHAEPDEKTTMWSAQTKILQDLGVSVVEWDTD
jgi:probable rRNA maturation factor